MVWFSISTTPAAIALSLVRGQQAAGVVDDTAVVSFELVHAHYHTNKQERGEERHTQTKQRYASVGRVGTSFTLSLQTFLQSVDFGDLEHEREVCATIHCRLVPFMH